MSRTYVYTNVGQNKENISPENLILIQAIKKKNREVISKIVNNSFDIEYVDAVSKNTVLHIASKTNNKTLVNELLRLGANVNAKNAYGFTPRQIAMIHNNEEIVDMFFQYDCDAILKELKGERLETKRLNAKVNRLSTNNDKIKEYKEDLMDTNMKISIKCDNMRMTNKSLRDTNNDLDIKNKRLKTSVNTMLNNTRR